MFIDKLFSKPTALNQAIDDTIAAMLKEKAGTPEYAKLVDQLTKLYKLKEIDINAVLKEADFLNKQQMQETETELKKLDIRQRLREMKLPFGMKPETVAIIAANLLGIVLILNHERLNVVTTKAMSFVKKS